MVPLETGPSLWTENLETLEFLSSHCAHVKEVLDTAFSSKDKIRDNTKRLRKQLQEEKIYSEYFDPFSFKGSMKRLKKMIMEQSNKYIK